MSKGVTIKQRIRNGKFYDRLKNGDPTREGLRGSPLHHFCFVVPAKSCTIDMTDESFHFRLDPNSDCYHRLLSCICDALPATCDADDEVERLKSLLSKKEKCKLCKHLVHHHDPKNGCSQMTDDLPCRCKFSKIRE